MALLLDTSILIYFFKNAGAVRTHMAQCKDVDIKLCTPVLWELITGAFKAQDPRSQLARLEIAGIALSRGLTVVTRNTREFGRVAGLHVENWYDRVPGGQKAALTHSHSIVAGGLLLTS